jgi:hypothetical protein
LPLTFPSHAAAILPLYSAAPRFFHPTALVIGSCAPDFAYLLKVDGALSHHLPGVFVFCLPLGLIAFLWAEGLAMPALRKALPLVGGVDLSRLVTTRGLALGWAGWLGVVVALLAGALTHLLWDGFTHATLWPASAFYRSVTFDIFGYRLSLTRLLQHLSSAAGLAIFVAYLARCYPRLPEAGPEDADARAGAARRVQRREGAWGALLLLFGPAALLGAAAFGWRFFALRMLTRRALWLSFWSGVAAALIAFTVACVIIRLRARRSPSAGAA